MPYTHPCVCLTQVTTGAHFPSCLTVMNPAASSSLRARRFVSWVTPYPASFLLDKVKGLPLFAHHSNSTTNQTIAFVVLVALAIMAAWVRGTCTNVSLRLRLGAWLGGRIVSTSIRLPCRKTKLLSL